MNVIILLNDKRQSGFLFPSASYFSTDGSHIYFNANVNQKPWTRDFLEDLNVDGRIMIQLILKKQNVRIRTGVIWLMMESIGMFLYEGVFKSFRDWIDNEIYAYIKKLVDKQHKGLWWQNSLYWITK
jgi:hypothetical protein